VSIEEQIFALPVGPVKQGQRLDNSNLLDRAGHASVPVASTNGLWQFLERQHGVKRENHRIALERKLDGAPAHQLSF